MQLFLIFLLGLIFSAFGTVVGFGGAVFMVPVLVVVFHVPIEIAVGSTIFALLPSSLISTYFNFQKKKIDFRAGIFLEIPTIIGTVIGSLLTSVLPHAILETIFGVFVSGIGIYTLFKEKGGNKPLGKDNLFYKLNKFGPRIISRSEHKAYRISLFSALIFGMLAGIMAGLLGIGGGFLKTPIMINAFGMPSSIAAATALFMIVFTSLTGSISHYFLGHINFVYGAPIISGFVLGAFIGNRLNIKLSESLISKLIGLGLILAGLFLIINVVFMQ